MAHWLTPTLLLGRPPEASHVAVETVSEALAVIESGRTALLPEGAWDTAKAVLEGLGLDEDTVADRLHYGQTGQPLRAV